MIGKHAFARLRRESGPLLGAYGWKKRVTRCPVRGLPQRAVPLVAEQVVQGLKKGTIRGF